jgi:hypothetical protein
VNLLVARPWGMTLVLAGLAAVFGVWFYFMVKEPRR